MHTSRPKLLALLAILDPSITRGEISKKTHLEYFLMFQFLLFLKKYITLEESTHIGG